MQVFQLTLDDTARLVNTINTKCHEWNEVFRVVQTVHAKTYDDMTTIITFIYGIPPLDS